jgi:hypothetical protein
MTSLMAPPSYFATYSAANLAQHPGTDTLPEVTPWRRILAVEPDITALNTKSLLLTRANYCVTRATSDRDVFRLRGTNAVAVAILSDHLGQRLLGTVAEAVRRQWPRTRILILGQVPSMLEDYLYDEQIDRSPDPKQVLGELEGLYRGMWHQRSNTLDWNAGRSALSFARQPISESEPTKTVQPALAVAQSHRGMPSDIRTPKTRLQ